MPAAAHAESTSWTVTEFSKGLTGQPELLAASPSGSIWFTESGDKVGRITGSGEITEYSVPGQPDYITVDSAGDAWIGLDERDEITRVTPAGLVSNFSVPAEPLGVAFGPDGDIWYTDLGSGCTLLPKPTCAHYSAIGRLTPTGSVTEFPLADIGAQPVAIIAGPDGNLWFSEELTFLENPIAENGSGAVGRITPGGVPTDYPIPFGPSDAFPYLCGTADYHGLTAMTTGPDGNIWAGETDECTKTPCCTTSANIARITPQGAVTLYFVRSGDEIGTITSGPENALWFGISGIDDPSNGMGISRSTTTGVITEYELTPTTLSTEIDYATEGPLIGVDSLAAGAEGDLWFAGTNGGIGRVNFHGIPPAAPANTSPPTISGNAKIWQTLSCNPGSWSGSPLPTFSYQWQRNGIAVSGATSPSYTVELPDMGHALTCVITAENSVGTAHVTSAAVRVSAGSLSGGSCPDVAIFGARGSGEDNTAANVGMGPVPYLVAQQIRNDLPIGLRVEMIGVNYPAVSALAAAIGTGSNYLNSVINGAEILVEGYNGQVGLVSLVRSCPKATIVLVGLSQGAQVIHYTMSLAPPHPSAVTSRIAAVLLFGDPVRQPHQSYNVGSQTAKGVLTDLGPLPDHQI
jgi:streptogramin lyase